MSSGQCDPTGLDADKVARYENRAFGSCDKITLPGLDLDIGMTIRCTGAGVKVSLFEDKTCNESSKIRHAYIGKSCGCMLVTGAGHYASLVWDATKCKEGSTIQASDTCQSKSNELAASEPAYIQNLYDCEEYYCPEIKQFKGILDYGQLKSDCTCTVDYKDKHTAMEKCKALPGGAKTCFVTYKVENAKGARLHIGNGMADCIPESCLATDDLAALTQQWTLSCLDIPGVSTCTATVKCEDPPATTTAAPTPQSADIASGSDRSLRIPVMTLCAALLLLLFSDPL